MRAVRCARRAFTLIELLVVIFILGLLIAIMLPTLCRSREQGNRVKCASNLRQIGLAIQMYANDNKGNFPRTYFDNSDEPTPTAFTGAGASDPFASSGPAANDVSAAFYLLLRTQDLTAEVFVCPSSSAERTSNDPRVTSNWRSAEELSYSYTNPYPSKACRDAMKRPFTFSPFSADFAIAADLNPGRTAVTAVQPQSNRAEVMAANSDNHSRDGQNVLYGDGHVEFQTTPFAGDYRSGSGGGAKVRDNIYVSGGPGTGAPTAVMGPMADPSDSVLLPAANPATAPAPMAVSMNTREFGARRIVWLTSAGVLLGACGAGGAAVRMAKKRKDRPRRAGR